jgi:SP family sugar:H+ symporter-like MFS transporter
MAVGTACFWLSAFLITFTLPYLYNKGEANLNAKVGFVYAAGSLLGMACVYWLIPETRGRTLEQINVLMEMDLPTLEWEAYVFPDEDMSSENGTVAEHEVGFKKEMLEDKLETTTVDGGAADRV